MSFRILSFLTDAGLKMFSAHSKKKSVTNTKILVRNPSQKCPFAYRKYEFHRKLFLLLILFKQRR